MSIEVEKKATIMTGADVSDDGNSSSSSHRLDDYHDTSGRELDPDDRKRYGNVYGSAKRRTSAVVTAVASSTPSKASGGATDFVPLKLEHKRARNREAASRCRKRKLDRIAALESRVAELNQTNESLLEITSMLTSQVSHLKQQVIQHVTSGCDLSLTPLLNQRQSPPPSASSSTPSPSSPVRHVVPPPPPPPPIQSPSRHRLPPSPPRPHHHHPRTPSSPPSLPPSRPPSLYVTSIPPMKQSPPLPSRDSESPEVEDVCLNLTVSSRRSPDDPSDGIELKMEDEEPEMEENGNHIRLKNV